MLTPPRYVQRTALALGTLAALAGGAPASAAPAVHSLKRNFDDASSVTVRIQGQLASTRCRPSLVLVRNRLRVSLRRGGHPAWRLDRSGRTLARMRGRSVTLALDASSDRILLRTGGRLRRVIRPLRPERAIRLTASGKRCLSHGLKVRATRRVPRTRRVPAPPRLPTPVKTPPASSVPPAKPTLVRPFAADSFWNKPLPAAAPLDARSSSYVADLNRQIRETDPWINTTEYSTPVYTVPATQPKVRVQLDEVASSAPDLARAWEQVPIPPDALPAAGSDRHMVVWQPSTDTMWEFWRTFKTDDGWHARWGGRMQGVSTNPGYFTNPSDWGATATSLPLLGGLIRLNELAAGHIDHALALAIPEARAQWFSWPAQRTDGHIYSESAIPQGARFRLDPKLDLSKMQLTPLVRMLAEAAQKYGIVLRDKAGAVTFFGEDPTPTGTNPYAGPQGYFGSGWLNQTLEQFPWQHLQVLQTEMACCWKRG